MVISGGAVTAQQVDAARMEIATNTRDLIESQDIYAAIEYIQESGDFKVITARYHNLIFDLYWQEKALFAMVPVAQAGIQYALTKAREFDSEDSVLAGKMRSFVKMWSFNLASFTWPGWQEEGIVITEADRKAGLQAAQLNVRICKELGEGPEPVASAYWILGAHLLSAGIYDEAIAAFQSAVLYAQEADDRTTEQMNLGYSALASILSGDKDDAPKAFSKSVKKLMNIDTEDSRFYADQLEQMLEFFTSQTKND